MHLHLTDLKLRTIILHQGFGFIEFHSEPSRAYGLGATIHVSVNLYILCKVNLMEVYPLPAPMEFL